MNCLYFFFFLDRYIERHNTNIQQQNNTAFGFHSSYGSGKSYEEGWITYTDNQNFGNDYVLSSQRRNMYRANGMDYTAYQKTHTYSSRLTINRGSYYGGYTSHFGCTEIIMVNQELPLDEIKCVEDYLNDKYEVFRVATANPGQCMNDTSTLVGWYNGDSLEYNHKSMGRYFWSQ